MNPKTHQFKTNINCGGCIEKIAPFFNNEKNILQWEVDTKDKNKILTIQFNGITENEIMQIAEKAGFSIKINL
jgi:copper chaperone